ncbi:hypothetical protein J3459_022357 [Metarhizium acridum]|nr:hypothetical protein J3459_022357 [Metarhizium acridum]
MVDVPKWVNGISSFTDETRYYPDLPTSQQESRKRTHPLSPDPSSMDGALTPTKRRRQHDADRTPVATALKQPPRAPRTMSSSPTKSSASIRSSSQSSSRRTFTSLQVYEEGIIPRQLSGLQTQNLPSSIEKALLRIRQIDRCKGILSPRSDPSKFETFRRGNDLNMDVFAKSETDGSRLTPEEALDIAEGARRCFEKNHDEDNWTCDVHHVLFKKVFRRSSPNTQQNLVDFARCTSAYIIREYLPTAAPDRRIDMCTYIDPSAEPDYATRIDKLRRTLPEQSINHSSYIALRNCPTSCSVEIKRSGNDFDGAVLQIGVRQAAQWKMLRALLQTAARQRISARQAMTSQDDVFVDDGEEGWYVDESLKKLGALPGIYSQGHEWYYVATSPEIRDEQGRPSLRTILWLQEPIGRTNTDLGIHRIAAFLEYIRDWSASFYWPWFKECILE